jgi:hypothetical protein
MNTHPADIQRFVQGPCVIDAAFPTCGRVVLSLASYWPVAVVGSMRLV